MHEIVGPILKDLDLINLESKNLTLATAFYSRGALDKLEVAAENLTICAQLDLSSLSAWISGRLDPPALLRFIKRSKETCKNVSLMASNIAHAKIYAGDSSYLLGSANLSLRGFAGLGHEILFYEDDVARQALIASALDEYKKQLAVITFDQLDSYIKANEAKVVSLIESKRSKKFDEDVIPHISSARPLRLGGYDDFIKWLILNSNTAASEILARAQGKNNLSGHIHRNFYGVRQFLLSRPHLISKFSTVPSDSYSLLGDDNTCQLINNFVKYDATNELDFDVTTWRNYLPGKCGGSQDSGGATSGNLNRMIPLIAAYLAHKLPT